MRIAAFGDLHLGHRHALTKFNGSEESLLLFADHLERNHDRVILMGDLYQTDYGRWPGSRKEVLQAIMQRFPRISQRWRDAPYTMVVGNHDGIVGDCLNGVEEVVLENQGWRLWFIHGHQYDPLSRSSRHPYLVTWGIGVLRRLWLRHVANFLEGPFFQICQALSRPLGAQDLTARQRIEDGTYDLVVMGHTHSLQCQGFGSGVYANSGYCTANHFVYVSIDTVLRRVEARFYQPPDSFRVVMQWAASAFP